jgi:DHA2 family multidrug resistance protein-like MFS transporter
VLAGIAVRYWSQRAVLAIALVLIATAMGSLTALSQSTTYPQIGIALFVIGAGMGVAFAVANDVVIASVPARNAGAAAAISETAYELGTALGIALLGSVIVGVLRHGVHDGVNAHAEQSFAAAPSAFVDGLAAAAGIGSALLLASALAVWVLLKPPPHRQPCSIVAPTVRKVRCRDDR